MNYTEAAAYLNSFVNLERNMRQRAAREALTLDRVRELARRLGNPQDHFKSLHVAGTKGKGSTCAFATAILQAAGLKTGLYISPHLQHLRERISVAGRMISEADFARLLGHCEPALEAMRNAPQGQRRPTYFEALTHIAFAWFAEEKVDAAVIEVGLGGRLDATNIITPVACGITHISFDHTAILGSTLEEIAREKAGIFKPGIPAVSVPQEQAVRETLQARARESSTPLEWLDNDLAARALPVESLNGEWPLPRGEVRMPGGKVIQAQVGLRGAFQIQNWALAVRLSDHFFRAQRGEPLPAPAVQEGSRNVRWPGRLEEIADCGLRIADCESAAGQPRVFLDGAHNDLSLKLVLREVRANLPKRKPLVVLFGCARDKDVGAMLRVLADPASGPEHVIFTHSGQPRGLAPAELARIWKQYSNWPAPFFMRSAEGLIAACRLAGGNGVVLVTGSLYLVGAIKDFLDSVQP